MSAESRFLGERRSSNYPPRTPGSPPRPGWFRAAAGARPRQRLIKSKGAPARCLLWQLRISVNKNGVLSINDSRFFPWASPWRLEGGLQVPHSEGEGDERDARHPSPGTRMGTAPEMLHAPAAMGQRGKKNHPPANCCAGRGAGVQPRPGGKTRARPAC